MTTLAFLAGRPAKMVERNAVAYWRMWAVFVSGLLEPVLFLLSIGLGVGGLVGDLPGPGGESIPYDVFVAPGLMAMAAMVGSVADTTFNFFIKYKYGRLYDAVLATPMRPLDIATGEIVWALLRGALYATAFLVTMVLLGLVESGWALLTVPAALLVGFAFAAAGLAAATWMRSFVDFDLVWLATMPLFLFSGTFFPVERYPEAVEWIVRVTPLYQGVELERALVLGDLHWALAVHATYLVAMGVAGLRIAGSRLGRLLQP